ncbi:MULTISPECIES: hypothetical protein [Mucilaginibacter]|jgi:hypothetical protein|uniref:hypothetical protein n=1 Tax=Mucilaginibacter TaxID=423349 RepID=UPI00087121E8|nr:MULTISPECIES: hypothetical protein [Mucilaginibacter]NVM64271.1 hypothetical protein [Mucilaginibacter sp. SG538B]SCW76296.1 hypothetical protein SAMN03159284_03870 [Mucilaginibacter sp. NFR10]
MKSARRNISTHILPAHHTITLNNVTIKAEPVNQGFNKQWCFNMPASADAEIVLN